MTANALSQLYAPGSEDLMKAAAGELFAKLAAENNIDLTQLSRDQVNELYQLTFKTAEEESKEEKEESKEEKKDEDEDKEAAAYTEYSQKIASIREDQRARELGVKMAEAYVEHLRTLGAELQGGNGAEESKEAAMPEHLAKALGKVRGAAGHVAGKAKEVAGKGKELAGKAEWHARGAASKATNFAKEHKGHAAAGGAAAAAGGAGFAAGRMGKKKEGSAIDQAAIELGIKIAFEGGLDPEEAADRLMAVQVLGSPESTKMGSTLEQHLHIRALEFLEAAGYPVEWTA